MIEVEKAAAELAPHLAEEARLNLLQSVFTHYQRLLTLPLLGLPSNGIVLDVGAGTGAMSLDMARSMGEGGRVFAVDNDPAMLEAARRLAEQLRSPLETVRGDANDLPFQDDTFDVTAARFLFQHLPDPAKALAEMVRVTRPGGLVAVLDVDDGTILEEPPLPPAAAALYRAVTELQVQRGGDRQIGRKLHRLFREAKLAPVSVIGIPRVQLGAVPGPRSEEIQTHHLQRLEREREAILAAGLLDEAELTAGLDAVRSLAGSDRFVYEVELVAVGTVNEKRDPMRSK